MPEDWRLVLIAFSFLRGAPVKITPKARQTLPRTLAILGPRVYTRVNSHNEFIVLRKTPQKRGANHKILRASNASNFNNKRNTMTKTTR